eukprot:s2397_g8.t1
MPGDDFNTIPTWTGDPSDFEFESFVQSCRWYERSLKTTECGQAAAARVWSRLQGAAKAVARHLNPDDFSGDDGLTKLLGVLQQSPLQQLPASGSFSRLERWHQLRRHDHETIAELLVHEEDMLAQMQSAVQIVGQNYRRSHVFPMVFHLWRMVQQAQQLDVRQCQRDAIGMRVVRALLCQQSQLLQLHNILQLSLVNHWIHLTFGPTSCVDTVF